MGMNPQMMEMMKQMDFSQEKVQAQFSELGLKPEDVINKVLATPDLAAGFSNPKVLLQTAAARCTQLARQYLSVTSLKPHDCCRVCKPLLFTCNRVRV